MLAYSGVLTPDTFLPNKCLLPPGISCIDFNVETSRVVLILQNSFGRPITIEKVDVVKKNGGSCSSIDPLVIEDDRRAIFTVLDCNNGNVGDKFKGNINVTYTKEGALTKVMKGSIIAEISAITTTTSANVCQTAETGGLCDGLDIVYGIGYKVACCSEHTFCCG